MLSEAKHLSVDIGLITTLVPHKAESPCVTFLGNAILVLTLPAACLCDSCLYAQFLILRLPPLFVCLRATKLSFLTSD